MTAELEQRVHRVLDHAMSIGHPATDMTNEEILDLIGTLDDTLGRYFTVGEILPYALSWLGKQGVV